MSFRRQKANAVAAGAMGAALGLALIGCIIVLVQLPAIAQTTSPAAGASGDFERPYGFAYGQEQSAFEANTRDANGNRVILDGRIATGMDQSSLSGASASASSWALASSGAGFLQGAAIGNQLNVITQGNYNTVIINATQTNTGNQTAVLNGKIELND